IEIDHDHGGIVKLAPLADWTEAEVWDYIRANEVPFNALYDKGYKSIGCAPCTRVVGEGQDARAGRWWWETGAPKECGMHCSIETGGFGQDLARCSVKKTADTPSRSDGDGERRPAQSGRIDHARWSPARHPHSANSGVPRRNQRSAGARGLSLAQVGDRVARSTDGS